MSVLWIAFGIYIIGVATVLYMRPGIMFREDGGAWKEFGISNKGTYTIFPFWLFAVVWAFMSYTFATLSAVFFASIAMRSVKNTPVSNENMLQSLYNNMNMNKDIKPISSMNNTSTQIQLPGYYVLEPQPVGPPKYIYFGQQPPA